MTRQGGRHPDRVIIDEVHEWSSAAGPEPPPDDCPVHHLPREAPLTVRDAHGPMTTTVGGFCDLWHDMAPLRAMFAAAMADAQRHLTDRHQGHTVVPPAFRRDTTPNTLYPRVRREQ